MLTLLMNCNVFQTNPALAAKPYDVGSRVSPDSLRECVSAIRGAGGVITSDDVGDLRRLCDEFQFAAFGKKVEHWQSARTLSAEGADG